MAESGIIWISIASIVWVVGLALWIVNERRSAISTLAWLLVLVALPFIGILGYYAFGPRRLTRRRRKRNAAQRSLADLRIEQEHAVRDLDPVAQGLALMCERGVGTRASSLRPAQIRAYFTGVEAFAAIEAAVHAARHHVHMEYYIWEPDGIGTRLRDALVKRAQAGVEVRLVLDAVGSSKANRRFWKPLLDAGGMVHHYNPLRLRIFRRQLGNFRTHRKIVVVDGKVGFTGGMNITEVHSSEFSGDQAWRDTHIRAEGPAVQGLQIVFLEAWHDVTDSNLEGKAYFPSFESEYSQAVQVVSSGPDESINPIHKLYVSAIASARERVYLSAPYFIPDEAIFGALVTAALRGADVRVLVPHKNDLLVVGAASRSYFPDLLNAGVRIFEYRKSMLHAKGLIVDSLVAVVGTSNCDPRSFRLNFEVIMASYEAQSCELLASEFEKDCKDSSEVKIEEVLAYGRMRKMGQNLSRLLSPIL